MNHADALAELAKDFPVVVDLIAHTPLGRAGEDSEILINDLADVLLLAATEHAQRKQLESQLAVEKKDAALWRNAVAKGTALQTEAKDAIERNRNPGDSFIVRVVVEQCGDNSIRGEERSSALLYRSENYSDTWRTANKVSALFNKREREATDDEVKQLESRVEKLRRLVKCDGWDRDGRLITCKEANATGRLRPENFCPACKGLAADDALAKEQPKC